MDILIPATTGYIFMMQITFNLMDTSDHCSPTSDIPP